MRILIVDDHQLFIDGISLVLNKIESDVEIMASTRAEEAIGILESSGDFDLVLVDLIMPGIGGLSIVHRMHEKGIWLPLVVVSGEDNLRVIKSALDMGALGFIPKSFSGQEMLAALTSILDGNIFVPTALDQKLKALKARRSASQGNLTKRQQQVLELIAQGYSNHQIATTLFLTEHTVKAHVSALFAELNASNRTDCVQIAQRQGII